MSKRTILVVALSLVFGLSAAVGAARLTRGGGPAHVDTVGVVVVTGDIPRFAVLGAANLEVKQYPKALVPPGAATSIEEAVGRVTDTPLVKDEPLLESKLTPKGSGRGMAAGIPPGMRAVTLRTPNVASGVAGFVLPGNKVDVMFTRQTHKADDPTGGGATRTLIPGAEVLAVDRQLDADGNSTPVASKLADPADLKSVTLLLTPNQAAQIDLAQTVGTIHLALRSPLDKDMNVSARATLKGIETGREGVSNEDALKLLAGLFTPTPAKKPTPEPVAVAPPPAAVTKKPAAPRTPPRIRTLRGGVPSTVYIE